MRIAVPAILAMATGASAFGVSRVASPSSTQLFGMPEEMTGTLAESATAAARWREIRLLSDEDAEAQLEGEELETWKEYHQNVKDDIEKMKQVADMMMKSVEPPRIQPKGKKQRKRDRWAKVVARDAARAAMALK